MVFYHPKYYKELRKRNKSDQAISSLDTREVVDSVRPGPGLRGQAKVLKLRASSAKLREQQASGGKLQAPSCKDQASSHKRQAP